MGSVRLAALAALFAGLFLAAPAVEAKGRFDGNWRIIISGNDLDCIFGYRTAIRVTDHVVSWRGRRISRSMIGISSGGRVSIRLSDGKNVVTGSGSVGKKLGNGRWSAPSFRCSGRWSAIRY
jgi:hypothetical protein